MGARNPIHDDPKVCETLETVSFQGPMDSENPYIKNSLNKDYPIARSIFDNSLNDWESIDTYFSSACAHVAMDYVIWVMSFVRRELLKLIPIV